jgi:hypothetical protein
MTVAGPEANSAFGNKDLAELSRSRSTARMKEHAETIEPIEGDDDQVF